MNLLIPVDKPKDIPARYRKTPIGKLLEYHNLGKPFEKRYSQAELLVGMCMDSRKHLKMPDNFAFIIRSGGANLRYSEFKVSYAIGVGGAQAIALIGHNNCGMVNVESRRDLFIAGLVKRAGWKKKDAEEHFDKFAAMYEIGSERDFVLSEVKRLRKRYPKIPVVPMVYNLENNRLYILRES